MLIWYQPKPNEVNFLPWLEHYLERRRRSRWYLYGGAAVIVVLGLVALAWVYINLLQVQADVQRQVADGVQQLQVQRRNVWAGSLEQRRIEQSLIIQAQQEFQAWLPVQELSRLLMILAPDQQLVSWQWQPIREGQQVVFAITGQGPWQQWWQDALNVWPSIHMEALGPEGDGWKFEARYLLPIMPLSLPEGHTGVMPTLAPFALQLIPQPLSVDADGDVEFQPIAHITSQVAKYGKSLEIARGQGVQVKMQLDSAHWARLAPLPGLIGWNLQHLSIQQTSSVQWQVLMQWLPSSDSAPSSLLRLAPSAAVQAKTRAGIEHYAQTLQSKTLPTSMPSIGQASQEVLEKIGPALGTPQRADDLEFIGYSQQQSQVPVAWIKSLSSGRLLRAEVGDQIDGWRVSAIGAQGVHLIRRQQVIMLERRCLTGVCRND
jgi:hypothetical protein